MNYIVLKFKTIKNFEKTKNQIATNSANKQNEYYKIDLKIHIKLY